MLGHGAKHRSMFPDRTHDVNGNTTVPNCEPYVVQVTRFAVMASDQFYLFAALASFNKEIQEKLRHVQTPEAILAVASEHGYQISLQQLIYYSARLNADHWIWVHKDEAWRERFFARERQLDLQAV